MTRPANDGGERGYRLSTGSLIAVALALVVPIVALLWVGSYDKAKPTLWGIPFFYWYQFLWVFVTPALTYVAHRIVANARTGGTADPADPAGSGGSEEEGAGHE